MRFFKKFAGLFAAALLLIPSLGNAYTINGNLDVRGNVNGGLQRIGSVNLTLSLSGGTLKIQCGNADCSASNPGWVTLPSTTAGQIKTYKVTSSPTFGDSTAGDSDFVGTGTCSWGTTAGVAWSNTLPILIGATHDNSTLVFILARGPVRTTGSSSNIGYQDVCPSTADQTNVIAMTSSNVTSSHADREVTWLGSTRITKNSSDNWTFNALNLGDGIGVFANFGGRFFDMPTGQMGATSGKFFNNNGGTAATYTATSVIKFQIGMDGNTDVYFDHLNTSGGTAGSGAQDIRMNMPLNHAQTWASTPMQVGAARTVGNASNRVVFVHMVATGTSEVTFSGLATTTTLFTITNADQSSTAREIKGNARYPAF
jgi:hypothetical protein